MCLNISLKFYKVNGEKTWEQEVQECHEWDRIMVFKRVCSPGDSYIIQINNQS